MHISEAPGRIARAARCPPGPEPTTMRSYFSMFSGASISNGRIRKIQGGRKQAAEELPTQFASTLQGDTVQIGDTLFETEQLLRGMSTELPAIATKWLILGAKSSATFPHFGYPRAFLR